MKNLKWILWGMMTMIMTVTLMVSCDDDDDAPLHLPSRRLLRVVLI